MKPKNSGLIDSIYRIVEERKKNDNIPVELVVFDKEYFEEMVMARVEPGTYWHNVYNEVYRQTEIYEENGLDPCIIYNKKLGTLVASSMQAVNGELH